MPQLSKTLCSRCGKIHNKGECEKATHRWGSRDKAKEKEYGWFWKKLRMAVMRRDQFMCQPCKKAGRVTAAKEVDHIVPKSQGGTNDPDNLQAICSKCHQQKTSAEGRGVKELPR